ncbi:hypothetical protein GCM10023191_006850 [Actinoallomurus oryzae]|uniref:WD40 repeat domain-containing protein n=1 Tax=Actinoallomurus oryzae TaxID=502180 RepID=A0ABP8PC97_9ACTN
MWGLRMVPIAPFLELIGEAFSVIVENQTKRLEIADAQAARRSESRHRAAASAIQGALVLVQAGQLLHTWQQSRRQRLGELGVVPPGSGAAAYASGAATRLSELKELKRYEDELSAYPIMGGPGVLAGALALDPVRPLVLIVPPREGGDATRWGDRLVNRVSTDLGRYHEILQVRIADRPFQWPHAGLYANDLAQVPTVIVELLSDRERLDIRVGGCHLGFDDPPVLAMRPMAPLRFPRAEHWSGELVDELNRSAPRQAFTLVPPSTDDELADLNHELAARVSTLCAVAMVDCHHLARVPGYDERLDQAIAAAGVVGTDWPINGLIPLPLVADPAYHLLHQALRRQLRGQHAVAEEDLRLAVTLLAGTDAAPESSLRELIEAAFATGRMHHKHLAKLREAVERVHGDRRLLDLLDRAQPWRLPSGDEPEPQPIPERPAAIEPEPEPAPVPVINPPVRTPTGAAQRVLSPHSGWVNSVAWSPDGRFLAAAADVGYVWDTADGGLRTTLMAPGAVVKAVSWSPDGRRLATSGDAVHIWDPATGELRTTLAPSGTRGNVAWSPDGRWIAACGREGRVRIWDAATGELRHSLLSHPYPGKAVAWSPDGQRIAATSSYEEVLIWDPVTGEEIGSFFADKNDTPIGAVAWSPDGQRIAGVSNGGAHLFVWDTAAPSPKFSVRVRKLASVAWSPAGDRFATGHTHQIINLWDPATGDVTRTLAGHIAARSLTFRTMPVAWSPDGRLLASGGVDRTARIWDV